MEKQEVLLDADNFCNGALSKGLRDGLEKIVNQIHANREDGRGGLPTGTGTVTIKVAFSVDVESGTVRAAVADIKVAVPKAKTEGQIIRLGSGGPVVDLVEDEVGNRRLFELKKAGE